MQHEEVQKVLDKERNVHDINARMMQRRTNEEVTEHLKVQLLDALY
jgi:hypothetical protein